MSCKELQTPGSAALLEAPLASRPSLPLQPELKGGLWEVHWAFIPCIKWNDSFCFSSWPIQVHTASSIPPQPVSLHWRMTTDGAGNGTKSIWVQRFSGILFTEAESFIPGLIIFGARNQSIAKNKHFCLEHSQLLSLLCSLTSAWITPGCFKGIGPKELRMHQITQPQLLGLCWVWVLLFHKGSLVVKQSWLRFNLFTLSCLASALLWIPQI